jgi:two-component system, NtrC family, sensor histidine kinase HydH
VRLFSELQRYVGFTSDDERRLQAVHPVLAPHFEDVAEKFYAKVLEHDDARAALERGERQVGHLKVTLVQWMHELFQGPWDDAYVRRRERIGRVHVLINLPQHYMITAMNVVRHSLREYLSSAIDDASSDGRATRDALQRILDLDLAIMLHTYREDLEARNARAERLATFGQLVGSIGHELRNPLGVIETSLYVLRTHGQADPRTEKHLERIGQQVVLANDIITQLLELIRERPLSRQVIATSTIVSDGVAAIQPHRVKVELRDSTEGATIHADPTQLRQIVVNLVDNAVHAAQPEGTARVSVTIDDLHWTLVVEDSGAGIAPEIRNRLFEPLVTTRPKGVGLGLALVRRMVERHEGRVDAGHSEELGGARFTVTLPRRGGEA